MYINQCFQVLFFLTRLEHQVQNKETLEKELYSRFVMLLNEKKAKIRGLQDTVRQLQQRKEEEQQRSEYFLHVCVAITKCI